MFTVQPRRFSKSPPHILLILLLAALLWSGEYMRRDLMAPDEARYALVSQEMREGHWLVPFRQGEFYTHKPPLMFWLTNVGSLLTGGEIGRVAPRLPSFLGAVLALWAATQLAALWFGTPAAWWVLLLLPSSFLFWNKGGFGQIDMLLCGLQMMALYFLFTATGTRSWLLAYAFMGLGILAKGPVGFLVPLGAYITAMLLSRTPFPRPHWHWAWGTLVALLFPAAWLGLVIWQEAPDGFLKDALLFPVQWLDLVISQGAPDGFLKELLLFPGAWLDFVISQGTPNGFLKELLITQNIERAAGNFGGHVRPWHYFIPYYLSDFLPWTFLLPAAWLALGEDSASRQHRRRLLGWILFVIVFFSLSASKRNLYILLVYPANAILIAGALAHWQSLSLRLRQFTALIPLGLLALSAVVMLVAPFSGKLPVAGWPLLPAGAGLLAGVILATRQFLNCPQATTWLRSLAITLLLIFSWTGAMILPLGNALKTPRELIEPTARLLRPGDRLICYRTHGEIHSLYTGFKGKMIFADADLRSFIETSGQPHHVILVAEADLADLQALFAEPLTVKRFAHGSKHMAWVEISAMPRFAEESATPE